MPPADSRELSGAYLPHAPLHSSNPGEDSQSRRATISHKKILVVAWWFPLLSETFVIDHILGLVKRGWEVGVATAHLDRSYAREIFQRQGVAAEVFTLEPTADSVRKSHRRLPLYLRSVGVRYAGLLASPSVRRGALYVDSLRETAIRFHPDVVHAHFGQAGVAAAMAIEPLGMPLVVDFHGYDALTVPKREGWRAYAHFLRSATAVAHSSFIEETLRRHLSSEVRRVRLGVDLSLFSAPSRSSTWPTPLRLLTVGRLVPEKGHQIAVQALENLRHVRPKMAPTLSICGEGPLEDDLRELVGALGLDEHVELVGGLRHDQVAALMQRSDMLLIPSIRTPSGWEEAFSRVAIEGLATGLPVVASELGGLPETVGNAGYLVRPGAPDELARSIATVVDSSRPADLAEVAQERAGHFTMERMWDEYEQVAEFATRQR